MTRFAFVALCVTATLSGAIAATPLEYGMTMTTRSYDAVCWYEYLKNFPETDSKGYFANCAGQAKAKQNQIENPSEQNVEYFNFYPDKKATMYGEWMAGPMGGLPSEYQSKCQKYMDDPAAEPPSDESDALNDPNSGNPYPFKGLAYCMMNVLREKHGDDAIEAVKNERTHKLKHWMSTLLDRDNEFRARHGAEPLKLVKDLNTAAQEWADDNAAKCSMYHSENDDPRRQWRGAGTGESLAAGGGDDNNAIAAYIASDGWYEENKDYPYPEYKGNNNDATFESIGHFTQSVWKGTKYVGYGYAYNPDCADYKFYIAARYWPAGNMEGAYGKNVSPPQ